MAAEFEFQGFIASVVTINCLANNFGEDGLSTLLAAIKGTSVRSLCGLTEGQTVADFSGQNLGPIDCRIMAAEFSFQGFITSVASISLSGNKITGTKRERREWKYDLDLSGIIAFGEAAAVSKTLASIDLSDCGISSKGIAEVARFMSAGASLTKVAITNNKISESDVASLRAAAPNGCEVVC